MEFNEKLQELRKNKGLTQEELAEKLYVSRTAVSKWESGRGYPNIESLKEISTFFSVSIDELLSTEKLLFIAEKENKSNIKNICEKLFSVVDLLSVLLIILPLYPNTVDGFIYSVNLLNYVETSEFNKVVYWCGFLVFIVLGIVKSVLIKLKKEKVNKSITVVSVSLNILIVLLFALTREVYALILVFLFLIIKCLLLFKYVKTN
jgi:transcriptional regulator with XRE-family HTH domain